MAHFFLKQFIYYFHKNTHYNWFSQGGMVGGLWEIAPPPAVHTHAHLTLVFPPQRNFICKYVFRNFL